MSLRGSKTKTGYIPWDTFLLLLNRLENKEDYKFTMLFAIGVFTGLRISDLKRIKWTDLINKAEIDITEQKTGKKRTIPINDSLKQISDRVYLKLNLINPDQIIVSNKQGTSLSTQYINKRLKEIIKEYKIPLQNVSTHMFRKTMGRRIWEYYDHSEKSLFLLSQAFNHSTIQITKIYLGITDKEINELYNIL